MAKTAQTVQTVPRVPKASPVRMAKTVKMVRKVPKASPVWMAKTVKMVRKVLKASPVPMVKTALMVEDGSDCTVAQTDCQATLSCEDGTLGGIGNFTVVPAIIVACAISIQTTIALGIAGTWGGSALVDTCGICRADPANDCVQDCAGTWGGVASWDSCGVCDDDATNDCVQDCAGMCGWETRWRMSVAPVMTTLPTIVF